MASLNTQLLNLQDGKPKKIHGISVTKEGDEFYIDETPHSIDNTISFLKDNGKSKGGKRGFPYDSVVSLLVKKPSSTIFISSHQIKDRKGHLELLEKAKSKKLFVYYADVKKKEGKFFAAQPWVVNFESVDNLFGPVENIGKISEPRVKPKPSPPAVPTQKQTDGEDEEDVVDHIEEVEDDLRCSFCSKKCSSTSGLTLHLKSKHPDEYMKSK